MRNRIITSQRYQLNGRSCFADRFDLGNRFQMRHLKYLFGSSIKIIKNKKHSVELCFLYKI